MTTNGGVAESEVQSRLDRLQAQMQARGIDRLVVTDRQNFEYLTGFKSLFWASATRPYFALVSRGEEGVRVIASLAEERNAARAPSPCRFHFYALFIDDAIRTLSSALAETGPFPGGIAIDYGDEMFGRGSLALLDALSAFGRLQPGHDLLWSLRTVKSAHEIEVKRRVHKIATDSFFAAFANLRVGHTEKQFARSIAIEALTRGADGFDFLPVRFGRSDFAYPQPPSDKALQRGDFIWADLDFIVDGYHSDVNRIAKAGAVTARENEIYRFVRQLTLQTAAFVKPGMTCGAVAAHYETLFAEGPIMGEYAGSGRIGHGSGLGLTEPPSLMSSSKDIIREGMVLHIEPKIESDGGVFQVEEAFVVRADGIEFLSDLSPEELPSLEC